MLLTGEVDLRRGSRPRAINRRTICRSQPL